MNIDLLRSIFNTREFNSRENYRFFGHNSESSGAFLTKIGGNDSYRVPSYDQKTYDFHDY